MQTKTNLILTFISLIIGGALSFASGQTMATGSHSGGHNHSYDFGKPGRVTEVDRTIVIVMKENFYEPKSVKVTAGETVRFQVQNKGELVHEFSIGTRGMHLAHQKEMEMMVEHGLFEADRINYERMKMEISGGKTMEHDDPNSVLLEPGKSDKIIWRFTKATKLEFSCNVLGHYDAGMVGQFHFN